MKYTMAIFDPMGTRITTKIANSVLMEEKIILGSNTGRRNKKSSKKTNYKLGQMQPNQTKKKIYTGRNHQIC